MTTQQRTARAARIARELAEAGAKAERLKKGRRTHNGPAHRAAVERTERLRRQLDKLGA
jgi:hypothetical protein